MRSETLSPVPAEPAACGRCHGPVPAGADRCPRCGIWQPGNRARLVHGARGGAALEAATATAQADLQAALDPELADHPRFRIALEVAGRSLARLRLLYEHAERVGLTDRKGRMRRDVVEAVKAAEGSWQAWARELGLTPLAASRLGLNIAQGRHASLAAELARARAERDREGRRTT